MLRVFAGMGSLMVSLVEEYFVLRVNGRGLSGPGGRVRLTVSVIVVTIGVALMVRGFGTDG